MLDMHPARYVRLRRVSPCVSCGVRTTPHSVTARTLLGARSSHFGTQCGCPHCYETRTAIFDYLDEYKNGTKEIKLYLFNIENGTNPKGEENRKLFKQKPNNYDSEVLKNEMIRTKPTSLSDTYFIGAPSLYHINEGALINLEIGTQDVANYLNYL